jgi:hypothetical protein
MNGSFIKAATLLIIHGPCLMTVGDEVVELEGYNVIPGCAGRKQSFRDQGRGRDDHDLPHEREDG